MTRTTYSASLRSSAVTRCHSGCPPETNRPASRLVQPNAKRGAGRRASDIVSYRWDGKARIYRSLVETVRTASGPRQSGGLFCTSSGLLATNLPLFPGCLQLSVPLRVDLQLPPSEHV